MASANESTVNSSCILCIESTLLAEMNNMYLLLPRKGRIVDTMGQSGSKKIKDPKGKTNTSKLN